MAGMGIGNVVGIGLDIAGNWKLAEEADKKIKDYTQSLTNWLPNGDKYQEDFFRDLNKYEGQAAALSKTIGGNQMANALAWQEQGLPGLTKARANLMGQIEPLTRGELPQSVMDAFSRSGGASSVGLGMGGSGFGLLNTGLFGARGSLGAIGQGQTLLGNLLSTIPQPQGASEMDFLHQLINPEQRYNNQLNLRQQQLAIMGNIAGMTTGEQVWGMGMKQAGAMLMGGGMGGGGGGMGQFTNAGSMSGGGFGGSSVNSGMSAGGLSGGGVAGGWGDFGGMSGGGAGGIGGMGSMAMMA